MPSINKITHHLKSIVERWHSKGDSNRAFKDRLKDFAIKNIPLLGLIVIVIVMSIASATFFTQYNLLSVLRQSTINGLLAFGLTIVIISGGIDLSVGSNLALTGMVTAQMITFGVPSPIAILGGLLVGALIGFINGMLIAKGKLPPFIATLAAMMYLRGLTLLISDGQPVSNLGGGLIEQIGRGELFAIPVPAIILLVVFGIMAFILKKTVFGKQAFAIGGNETGAELSGINVDRTKIKIYVFSGVLAALAGVIMTSRVDSAVPTAGQTYELLAIAAAVIGGASLSGGKGRAAGTIVGALIMGVIDNGLNLLGVSSYLQEVVTGLIIVFAIIADRKK